MAGQGGQPWAAAHLLLTRVNQPGCFTTQGHVGASSSWLRSVEKQEADLVVKATRPTGWGPSYLGPDRSLPACRETQACLPFWLPPPISREPCGDNTPAKCSVSPENDRAWILHPSVQICLRSSPRKSRRPHKWVLGI